MNEELLQPRPLDPSSAEDSPKSPTRKPRGFWWFILLVILGLFLIWNLRKLPPPQTPPGTPAKSSSTPIPTVDPALRSEAEAALEEALNYLGPLRAAEPERWAKDVWRDIEEGMSSGDQKMAAEKFSEATEHYRSVIPRLERLSQRLPTLPSELMPKAVSAYAKGNKTDSVALLNIILFLEPEHQQAKDLLPRAKVSDQSFSFLEAARGYTVEGEWELAWAELKRLDQVDAQFPGASELSKQVDDVLSQQEFQKWISQALSALENQDIISAQALLNKAAAYQPDHPSVLDLKAQVENLLVQQKVLALKDRAEKQELREEWSAAHQTWLEMKALDPDAPWIQEGLYLSLQWKLAEEKVKRALKNIGSEQTAVWIAEFKQRENWPPKLDARAQELVERWELATTPVGVTLISDLETRVQISKIGQWDPFREKELTLVPGTYVAKGIRLGYRDVRVPFEVKPGQQDLEVEVICRERI